MIVYELSSLKRQTGDELFLVCGNYHPFCYWITTKMWNLWRHYITWWLRYSTLKDYRDNFHLIWAISIFRLAQLFCLWRYEHEQHWLFFILVSETWLHESHYNSLWSISEVSMLQRSPIMELTKVCTSSSSFIAT